MSLYNMINGVKPSTFFILPMLGWHPNDIPRFRDCFTSDEERPEYDGHIHVYTRVGGGNRNCGYGEEMLTEHELFVASWDDSFDSTFATYCFRVPEEFKDDFQKFHDGQVSALSPALQARCRQVFPKLNDKFDELWGTATPV